LTNGNEALFSFNSNLQKTCLVKFPGESWPKFVGDPLKADGSKANADPEPIREQFFDAD
jgi:hypothetical protein